MLLKNCSFVVTQNKNRDILRNYDILIKGDRISKIGKNLESNEVIDCKGKAVLPGFVNCHTHLAMTMLRGYADDIDLDVWLKKYIWPFEAKLNEKKVYNGALLGCRENIRFGTTCFNDMYLFMEGTARAVEKSGLRAILCSVYFDFTKENIFKDDFNLIKKYSNNERIAFVLGPHAPYSCSKDLLIKSKEFAEKNKTKIHIHVSETRKEVYDIKKKYKMFPVEFLDSIGFLNEDVLIAHGTWLTKNEVRILGKRKVNVAHCPTSNMKLASGGILPLMELWKENVNVGLGTDGCASNNNLDMFKEMKLASLLHKASRWDPTLVNAQEALDLATINGAKALGLNKEIGSIEIGKKADLITLDLNAFHLRPVHNLISNIVYSANGNDVNDTIVDGKVLMKDKKVLV